jgi:hypothetical protein
MPAFLMATEKSNLGTEPPLLPTMPANGGPGIAGGARRRRISQDDPQHHTCFAWK